MFQPKRTRTISLSNSLSNYFRQLLIFYITNILTTSLPLQCYVQLYTQILSNPTVIRPLAQLLNKKESVTRYAYKTITTPLNGKEIHREQIKISFL